jgi:hypothetical protein
MNVVQLGGVHLSGNDLFESPRKHVPVNLEHVDAARPQFLAQHLSKITRVRAADVNVNWHISKPADECCESELVIATATEQAEAVTDDHHEARVALLHHL